MDYLEAARYAALNWSEAECRKSGLRRVLPRRRYAHGTRQGLRGEGPQEEREVTRNSGLSLG